MLDHDTVYTAVDGKPKSTRSLRRLDNIRQNPAVTLLVDHYDEDWRALWWVRVDGRAVVTDDPKIVASARRLLEKKYPQYGDLGIPGPVIVLTVENWRSWP